MAWEPITGGRSGVQVERRLDVVRKRSPDPAHDLVGEAERLVWLRAQGLPAPEVLEHAPGLLVMRAVPGREGADGWPAHQRRGVVDAMAGLLRGLHALGVEDCPFDRRLAVTVPEALAAEVDLDDLDAERAGWSRADLVRELLATRPTSEDLVVGHGDPCLPNVFLDPVTLRVTGVLDVGRLGVADRWNDLAIATRSLEGGANPQFGPAAAARLLAAYGVRPDVGRTTFYRLLDEFG